MRMTRRLRWAVVASATAVLVALPSVLAHLPAPASQISAKTLLARIRASADVAYSGNAESQGGLQLPDTHQLNSVAALLGSRSQLRVWYASADRWRVDSISPTGETDYHFDGVVLWQWDYESNEAQGTLVPPGQLHLPRASDLTPPELGRRFLSGDIAEQVRRLPTRRVAGRVAAGLRLTPTQSQSSISYVDVWADPRSGLPLQVLVQGKDGGARPIESHFLDVAYHIPPASVISFQPQLGTRGGFERNDDPLSQLDTRFARAAPNQLAGLGRVQRSVDEPAIAIYGGSVTSLVLVPAPGDLANSLLGQLSRATAIPVEQDGDVRSIGGTVGPVTMLVAETDRGGVVLAGTITTDAMQNALDQLIAAT